MKTQSSTPIQATSVATVVSQLEKRNEKFATIITLVFVAILAFVVSSANAQSPITAISSQKVNALDGVSYNAKGAANSNNSNTTYAYSYGSACQATDNQNTINTITVAGETLNFEAFASSTVRIRRVNNSVVSGTRSLLWVEKKAGASSNRVSVVPKYNDNMESVFDNNFLNQGTDNLFANQGDGNGNNNNIERLDVVFAGGIIPTELARAGFSFFERGDDNAHDPFVIAPITAVDVNGNPTAYGNIIRIATADYGNIPSSSVEYYVVRRDLATENNLRMSTSGTQKIGGVFVSFNQLGVTAGQKIFGYSIFAYDLPVTATSANLVDYNNQTYFPRNTSSATQQGGIDLIATTGVFSAPNAIILPPTAENIIVPTMRNTAAITAIAPLDASAASGTIESYTIVTIPATSQGVLYVGTGADRVAVTAGQTLTNAQIEQLAFQPKNTFIGNVVFTYYATDSYNQLSNTATYTIPVVASGTLPVRLTYFGGTVNGKLVQLNFQTADELNSSYFEIQRSENGADFAPVATITANGRNNVITNYTHREDLFLTLSNQVYYRLKMVDRDGTFKYSQVITFRLNQTATANLKAFPMPYSSQLNLSYNSNNAQQAIVRILSMDGKVAVNTQVALQKGQNNLFINQAQQLPAGSYVLQLIMGDATETLKITKQ
ncbi:MAG: hypothetical protein RLY16_891 [Bacteroidota bacterium]|jgi:hypothetical protein